MIILMRGKESTFLGTPSSYMVPARNSSGPCTAASAASMPHLQLPTWSLYRFPQSLISGQWISVAPSVYSAAAPGALSFAFHCALSATNHTGAGRRRKKKRGQKCEPEKNKRGRNRGPVQWSLARTLTAACRTSVRCPPVCFLALIVQRPGAISTVPPTGSGSGSTGKTESDYEKGPGIESRKLAGDTSARRLAFWQR